MEYKIKVWIVKTNKFWEKFFFTKERAYNQKKKSKTDLVFISEYKI